MSLKVNAYSRILDCLPAHMLLAEESLLFSAAEFRQVWLKFALFVSENGTRRAVERILSEKTIKLWKQQQPKEIQTARWRQWWWWWWWSGLRWTKLTVFFPLGYNSVDLDGLVCANYIISVFNNSNANLISPSTMLVMIPISIWNEKEKSVNARNSEIKREINIIIILYRNSFLW